MSRTIFQDLLSDFKPPISLETIDLPVANHWRRTILASNYLGFSVQFSSRCTVEALAFATPERVFLLRTSALTASTQASSGRLRGLDELLQNTKPVLAAFDMPRLALSIYRDLSIHIRGIDLSTILPQSGSKPESPSRVLRSKFWLNDPFKLEMLWNSKAPTAREEEEFTALRAWLAMAFSSAHPLDGYPVAETTNLSHTALMCIGNMQKEIDLLRAAQPEVTHNDFASIGREGDQTVIHNARYRNRVRVGGQMKVVLLDQHGEKLAEGKAIGAEGRRTTLRVKSGLQHRNVAQIQVIGRQALKNAEKARHEFFLLLLWGQYSLDRHFIGLLWFPTEEDKNRLRRIRHENTEVSEFGGLNPSQAAVVNAMLNHDLIIVHGPPGTGKTRTIGAAVRTWSQEGDYSWLIAQSNVGVKNIAESLLKQGFKSFKLLVSKEFFVEWHEHLYVEMKKHIERTDELTEQQHETARKFDGITTILCTLSTLSNPLLDSSGLLSLYPVTKLVVDEASQISVSEYMHILHKFRHLECLCFFGDPKQLPPYGQDQVQELKSVFDVQHLKPTAFFLNTQYRMPEAIGNFLSGEVYDGKLKSQHKHKDHKCLAFVDESRGVEERVGRSWKNTREVQTCVNLVKNYYHRKEFCIITPYDPQRAAIEAALKAEDLPWEKVYNVDSFQGNEAPYIIISVVRTKSPGFLAFRNRINVMLSRSKEGMVIVSNSAFLRTGSGRSTLIGRLAAAAQTARRDVWVTWQDIASKKADLPGAPGRPKATLPTLSVPGGDLHGSTPLSPTTSRRLSPNASAFVPATTWSPSIHAFSTRATSQSQQFRVPAQYGQYAKPRDAFWCSRQAMLTPMAALSRPTGPPSHVYPYRGGKGGYRQSPQVASIHQMNYSGHALHGVHARQQDFSNTYYPSRDRSFAPASFSLDEWGLPSTQTPSHAARYVPGTVQWSNAKLGIENEGNNGPRGKKKKVVLWSSGHMGIRL